MNETLFYSLWKPLLGFAYNRGIDHDAAQDLAMETIHKVINQFNPERGEMLHFAFRVMGNQIKNHIRANYKSAELSEDFEDSEPTPDDFAEMKEQEIYAQSTLITLKQKLNEDELKLIGILQIQIENSDKYNVSDAARELGIHPLKAHDMLRKIQRKLKNIVISDSDAVLFDSEVTGVREPSNLYMPTYLPIHDNDPIQSLIAQLNVFESISKYLNKS